MKKRVKNAETEEVVAGIEGLTAMPSFLDRWFHFSLGGMLKGAFSEGAGAFDYKAHRENTLKVAPDGHGEPVLVVAGLTHDDSNTQPWRDFLNRSNFCAEGTNTGPHRAPDMETLERLLACFDRLWETHGGRKVALVGHSLGGGYARALARLRPDKVSHVVFVGSPVNAKSDSGLIFTYFERIKQMTVELATRQGINLQDKISARTPVTAIYCRNDEIVGTGRDCRLAAGPRRENIVVEGGHFDLLFKPEVMTVLADRLGQSLRNWKFFDPAKYPEYKYGCDVPVPPAAPPRRKDITPAAA